ncbi:MAG: hypothetical protein AAGG75_28490 [Bacteroidota bacterium]
MNTNEKQHPENDQPPILNSWKQMYTLVLVLHLIIIILFYWFTKAYS